MALEVCRSYGVLSLDVEISMNCSCCLIQVKHCICVRKIFGLLTWNWRAQRKCDGSFYPGNAGIVRERKWDKRTIMELHTDLRTLLQCSFLFRHKYSVINVIFLWFEANLDIATFEIYSAIIFFFFSLFF
jgi:hypothetical protein